MAIYKKGYYDLYMYQGDTGNIKIKGIPETGNYSVYFQLSTQDGTKVFELMVESNFSNEVVFLLGTDITDTLATGTYCYAVKLCFENDYGMISEETVIPPLKNTSLTPSNFKNKAMFYVYPKQIEGM